LSTDLSQLRAPETLLRTIVLGLGVAWVIGAVGHAALGWDPEAWQAWLPSCLFRTATGFPCPGCGMTRAVLLLMQLRVGAALGAHPAAPVVVAAALAWGIHPPRWSPRHRDGLYALALVALLAVWAVRVPLARLPL